MPDSVKSLLEINEHMVQVELVLTVFFAEDSEVEDLLCSATACSKSRLFFGDDDLSLRFESV